jgi:uncharacterized RDD family membrane protein YckC
MGLKGSFATGLNESPAVSSARRAGFWIRSAAAIIDLIILGVPFCVFVSFLSVGMGLSKAFVELGPHVPPSEIRAQFGPHFLYYCVGFFVLIGWIYFAAFESSPWQATLGKRLWGMYLADVEGKPISFWRASRRFLAGRFLLHAPLLGFYHFFSGLSVRRRSAQQTRPS